MAGVIAAEAAPPLQTQKSRLPKEAAFSAKSLRRRLSLLGLNIGDSGLAAAVSCYLLPTEHPYLYTIGSVLQNADDFPAVENAIYQTIEDLIHRPVAREEVAALRMGMDWSEAVETLGPPLGLPSCPAALYRAREGGFYSLVFWRDDSPVETGLEAVVHVSDSGKGILVLPAERSGTPWPEGPEGGGPVEDSRAE